MKLRLALISLLSLVALRAADSLPVFNAILTVGKEHRFVLIGADGKPSSFLGLGESFDGFKLKAYDAAANSLEVERDGKVSRISLVADAAIANTPAAPMKATLADAEAVLNAMNFEGMMEKVMGGARKQQASMIDKMMGQMVPAGADREAMIAFQKKIVEEMMSAINFAELKGEMAKVYSNVFTKDQLDGLTGFFNSPAGQAYTDKQPEIAEKMNAIMMPKMMAVMPKIQKMSQEFAAEMKAKREAAGAAPAAPKQ